MIEKLRRISLDFIHRIEVFLIALNPDESTSQATRRINGGEDDSDEISEKDRAEFMRDLQEIWKKFPEGNGYIDDGSTKHDFYLAGK